ncbi:hypothetical protein SAY87_008417 [Trapa incisa]|uniref:Uncharacterized protein n=1 Tax=Trapa incisa TaxID=236973 RepID=A0AAN7QJE7_9MYRT|nr:hypothetical protein SAY87_008417 [Trapa incisa]
MVSALDTRASSPTFSSLRRPSTRYFSLIWEVLTLSYLKADYINTYEAASLINRWIIPDFVLLEALTLLLLVSGHWFMFLISVTITCYQFLLAGIGKNGHTTLSTWASHTTNKLTSANFCLDWLKYLWVKLGLLSILFLFVSFRCLTSGHPTVYSSKYGELDIRSSVLFHGIWSPSNQSNSSDFFS